MAKQLFKGLKEVKCMNWEPENSKWGHYAPVGGCKEMMKIDENSTKGLCSKCVSASVNQLSKFNRTAEED